VIPVEFKYKSISWLPVFKKIKATHPSSWGDLDLFQFAEVVEFLNSPYSEQKHDHLINSLLKLKNPLTGFPEEVVRLHDFIKNDYPLVTWVIKHLAINDQILLGPFDRFKNVTIGEFIFGDSHFLRFVKNNDSEQLCKFLACYYRPVNENPDINSTIEDDRIKFNPKHIERRAILFHSLDERVKNAIVFNYKNMRGWIQDQYTWVFPKGHESDQKNNGQSPWRNFASVIIDGDYVNQEKIMETLLHTVLYDMNQKIKSQSKNKRR
jgi:hypothetical protein